MKFFSDFFVTVFYIGRIPLAPGTFSSLFSVIIWFIFFKAANPIFLAILTIILFFLGVLACEHDNKYSNKHDPSYIVIDEFVGQWIVFLFIPVNPLNALIGFILFRFFDISKIGPVGYFERMPGGWGVMADDVVAGVLSLMILYGLQSFLP